MVWATVLSRAVALSLLINCFYVHPIVCLGFVFNPCFVMHAFLRVLSSFAIILARKRELISFI